MWFTVVLLVQDFDNVVFVEGELRTVGAFVPGEALVQNKVATCRTGGRGGSLKLVTVCMLCIMHVLLHMGHTNYLKKKKKQQLCHSSCGGVNIKHI